MEITCSLYVNNIVCLTEEVLHRFNSKMTKCSISFQMTDKFYVVTTKHARSCVQLNCQFRGSAIRAWQHINTFLPLIKVVHELTKKRQFG